MSKVLFAVLAALCLAGCVVDQYGRVLPPDPVGQALFNALDPATPVYEPREYVVESDYPAARYERSTVAPVAYSDPVWVSGHYGWAAAIGCGFRADGCSVHVATWSGMIRVTM